MKITINFQLNGQAVQIKTHPLRRFLDVLRDELGLTGVKEGCGEGECGACSVLLGGRLVNTCLLPAGMAEGKDIITIEGYRQTEKFALLKDCFEKAGSVQCGFCTPGMILASAALLQENPHPSEVEIRNALSRNLCRCTGYNMIVEAVMRAAREGEGIW